MDKNILLRIATFVSWVTRFLGWSQKQVLATARRDLRCLAYTEGSSHVVVVTAAGLTVSFARSTSRAVGAASDKEASARLIAAERMKRILRIG